MALHLLTEPLKKLALGWSRYQDVNPIPTSPLADDIASAPSGLTLYVVSQLYPMMVVVANQCVDVSQLHPMMVVVAANQYVDVSQLHPMMIVVANQCVDVSQLYPMMVVVANQCRCFTTTSHDGSSC